jgi:hypothetical protein
MSCWAFRSSYLTGPNGTVYFHSLNWNWVLTDSSGARDAGIEFLQVD